MIFEPEILLLAVIVVSITTMLWSKSIALDPAFSGLAIQRLGGVEPAIAARILAHRKPLLLTSAPRSDGAVSLPAHMPLQLQAPTEQSGQSQIVRLSQIVNAAIETAGHAERLQRSAHEQIDSAHYALQNLLDELSAIMPAAVAPAMREFSPVIRAVKHAPPRFETALAA